MSRRVYTQEFKDQAVELALSMGNISAAAKQLGIRDNLIHNWKEKQSGSGVSSRGESLEQELRRLRKENTSLKQTNHILKKAAAFFSQDHLK